MNPRTRREDQPSWTLAAIVLLAAACDRPAPPAPLAEPPPAPPAALAPADLRANELHLAVAAMLSPIATYDAYAGLFEALSREVGRPYQFVQRRTYQEVNDLLLRGELDLAFLCSGGYAALPRQAPVEIIAAPVVGGEPTYRAAIVTRVDSGIRDLAGLRDKRFAFTDPLSLSGYLYPASRVRELSPDPQAFFASTLFSGSHDRSLLALQQGLVDGAAVYNINFDRVVLSIKGTPGDLNIIDRSSPFPSPPVVAPTGTSPEIRARLRAFLVGLDKTPAGRALLERLGVDRFIVPADADYEPIRRLRERLARETP